MATMNRQLKLPQIQKIMMEFEKQVKVVFKASCQLSLTNQIFYNLLINSNTIKKEYSIG